MPVPICWIGSRDCFVDWNAWSAIGSLAAATAAAWFGTRELRRRRSDDKAAAREICSASERASAYREVAKRILDNPIHYHPQIESLKAIRLNSHLVANSLRLLLKRSNLTDGAIAVGVAGQEIASGVCEALSFDVGAQSTSEVDQARAKLERLAGFSLLLENRAAGVRREFGLGMSGGAARIRWEYGAMLDACDQCLISGEPPPDFAPF
jgi:hypothetical protein